MSWNIRKYVNKMIKNILKFKLNKMKEMNYYSWYKFIIILKIFSLISIIANKSVIASHPIG